MFNSLRLSIVVTVEVLIEIAADILADILMDIVTEITSGTELKVLLIAIYCWNSLKSYTSFST